MKRYINEIAGFIMVIFVFLITFNDHWIFGPLTLFIIPILFIIYFFISLQFKKIFSLSISFLLFISIEFIINILDKLFLKEILFNEEYFPTTFYFILSSFLAFFFKIFIEKIILKFKPKLRNRSLLEFFFINHNHIS